MILYNPSKYLVCTLSLHRRMLDVSATHQHDNFKRVYADLLYRWGLPSNRALVLKYVSTPAEPHQGLGEFIRCILSTYARLYTGKKILE